MIDTLSNNKIKLLAPELDSICNSNRDSLIRMAVDSILTMREEQVKRKLKELKQKNEH